jgi:hypothetical protein
MNGARSGNAVVPFALVVEITKQFLDWPGMKVNAL